MAARKEIDISQGCCKGPDKPNTTLNFPTLLPLRPDKIRGYG